MIPAAFQPKLRPALPAVFASKEYREFHAILVEMDRILVISQIEHDFILRQIKYLEKRLAKKGRKLSERQAQRHFFTFRLVLRYGILIGITGYSFRQLSRQVADSLLCQWFTYAQTRRKQSYLNGFCISLRVIPPAWG